VKALYHATCGDICAPHPNGEWRLCRCQTAAVRWADPERGILQATAAGDRQFVRVLGFDNYFLTADLHRAQPLTNEQWREQHANETRMVGPNYLFHETKRACPFVIIAPGESSDTSWVEWRTAFPLPEMP
jgi:hypothetical protein